MYHIRPYSNGDESALWNIFFNTIRNINIQDYSEQQVRAWAPDLYDENLWQQRMQTIKPFIVELDDEIVAYADVQKDGYIDHFYCHHLHQRKGIGRFLIKELVQTARQQKIARLAAHASLTAKDFFKKHGFQVIRKQTVEIRGQTLSSFYMEKQL